MSIIEKPNQIGVFIISVFLCMTFYAVVYITGGTAYPYPHIFYFVILFSSILGNWRNTLFTSVFSSVLMSYKFMPLYVKDNSFQNSFSWMFRSVMFILIGVIVKVSMEAIRNSDKRFKAKSSQLAKFQTQSLNALLNLSETKDPETTGRHLERMGLYAKALLKHINMDEIEKKYIIDYISLHDIGKVAIPDNILLKQSKLTYEEFNIIKTHTIIGGKILERIEEIVMDEEKELRYMLKVAKELTYYHHEKIDGTGYPQGLKGEEIPFSAKITALCDVYDALSSKRPYKDPFTHEKCIEIIVEGKGTQFDENIVESFLKVEKEFKIISEKYKDIEIGIGKVVS